MPIYNFRFQPDRVDFKECLTRSEVDFLVNDQELRFLQCSEPVDAPTWDLLNDRFFPQRPEVTLRVYGFYGLTCDLAFASRMSHVRHFCADCLMDATGEGHIADMRALETLSVGIYHLQNFDFLNRVTPELKRLVLGATLSKKPDLSPLRRFTALEEIYIEGQQKNIEVLSELENLKNVTLRSISTPDIHYLKPLRQMWSLDIKLGGIRDISAIEGMKQIKFFELWQVRELTNISALSCLPGLQFLFLQSLRHITSLPSLTSLSNLRRICLDNMKGLSDLSCLEAAPALEEYIHTTAQSLQPEQFIPLLRNPTLKSAMVLFGNQKKNQRFRDLAQKYQVEIPPYFSTFEFD